MTSPTEARLEILADPEALSRRVAEWMLELAKNKNGEFSVCLSGGSTPQQLYGHLAEPTYRSAFPWSRTHWFWGDERFVSHDDPLSNYRMSAIGPKRKLLFAPRLSAFGRKSRHCALASAVYRRDGSF